MLIFNVGVHHHRRAGAVDDQIGRNIVTECDGPEARREPSPELLDVNSEALVRGWPLDAMSQSLRRSCFLPKRVLEQMTVTA